VHVLDDEYGLRLSANLEKAPKASNNQNWRQAEERLKQRWLQFKKLLTI
jgi:hypothetical protein